MSKSRKSKKAKKVTRYTYHEIKEPRRDVSAKLAYTPV